MINPDPGGVVNNLGDSVMSEFGHRIIPVKGRFGDEDVFKKLEIAVKVESRDRYFDRLQASQSCKNPREHKNN